MPSKSTIFVTAAVALVVSASPQATTSDSGQRRTDGPRGRQRDETNGDQRGVQFADVIISCTVPNTAALTFDDGPTANIEEISNTLKAANAVGTFFVNGNNYDCIYSPVEVKSARAAFAQGHQIASHTWNHYDLATLSLDELTEEFARTDEALLRIFGVVPAFIRPPFGSYNDDVRRVARQRGQKLVLWDFDSGDSTGSTADESKKGYEALISQRPSTILALNHEANNSTALDVLPFAIERLQKAGYKLVSLAECLGLEAYQGVGTSSRSEPDSSWRC